MTEKRLREIIGRIEYFTSIALLIAYCLGVATAFGVAAHDRRIPSVWWQRDGENHGPWRHYQPVHTVMTFAICALAVATLLCTSMVVDFPGRRPFIVGVIALILMVTNVVFLHWLTA